jgi:hypothetical protein
MKSSSIFLTLSLLSLTACSTAPKRHQTDAPTGDSETVMVTYHVQSGKEAAFQDLLSRAWAVYQSDQLVYDQPHVILRDQEDGGKPRFVEIVTWKSHYGPDYAPDAVKTLWTQMQSLCEARDGHTAIEGGEVTLLSPPVK